MIAQGLARGADPMPKYNGLYLLAGNDLASHFEWAKLILESKWQSDAY